MGHVLDQIVIGLIAEAARPRLAKATKCLAARGVDSGRPRRGRTNREGAGVAQARPAEALPAAFVPRSQQVVPFRDLQLSPFPPFPGDNRVGLAEFPTPYRADIGIARIGDIIVCARDLKARKVRAGQEIGDASYRIRPIDGRGSLL